jgi:hypothetical protein
MTQQQLTANDCLVRAVEVRAQASKTAHPTSKKMLLDIAASYERLARTLRADRYR